MAAATTKPKVGDTLKIPLKALNLKGANYRTTSAADKEAIQELAESMAKLGQLHPISVTCEAGQFFMAAGYRRVAAAQVLKMRTIEAKVVRSDLADLVRLAENMDREDPSSFATCRYLWELHTGKRGRRYSTAELAEATGRSSKYVANLVRFYKVLPEDVRTLWEEDQQGRFSFRVLSELAVAAQTLTDDELRAKVARLLGAAPGKQDGPARGGDDGEDSGGAEGGKGPRSGSKGKKGKAPRRLGRGTALKLVQRLAYGGDRLAQDDRAQAVYLVLSAVAGDVPPSEVATLVDQLLAELGVVEAPAAKTEPKAVPAVPPPFAEAELQKNIFGGWDPAQAPAAARG